MPSDKKQYGSEQAGPRGPGEVSGKPVKPYPVGKANPPIASVSKKKVSKKSSTVGSSVLRKQFRKNYDGYV